MDLAACGSRVVITMEHNSKGGGHKIVQACTLPLTGAGVVNRIITELAVFDVLPGKGLVLIEIAAGLSLEELTARTGAPFAVSTKCKEF